LLGLVEFASAPSPTFVNNNDEKTNGSSDRKQNCESSQEEQQFFGKIRLCREQGYTRE
jgi:hypothetical protein